MTQEELFEDLKQFIETTVSQTEHRLEARMATKDDLAHVEQRLDGLDSKIDNLQTAIADTLTRAVEAVDAHEQVRDLQRRVTKLEHRTI